MNHEQLLRDALATKAAEAAEASVDLTLDDIRHGANRRRSRSRRRALVVLAAAAAVAVGIPAAILLRPAGDEVSPTPSPSPSPTATTPTTAPKAVLDGLPLSAPPGITYVEGGTIHLDSGGTAQLPGPASVAAFAAYHGGWLVGDAVMPGVRWYDNTGRVQRDGFGPYLMAASADGTRLAFSMDSKLNIGIASGMGEGEQQVPVVGNPLQAWPAGFLRDGALVYNDAGKVRTNQPVDHPIPKQMVQADAVSVDDVVAGTDAEGREIAWSARTGETLWSGSDWIVTGFSQDGRYAAALRPSADGGKGVAILDGHTGELVVEEVFSDSELDPVTPVMDRDGSLLFVGIDPGTQDSAVVRVEPSGSISRASQILRFDPAADPSSIAFATGP